MCRRTILETEKRIFDAILEGELDLESAPWPISAAAKYLIKKMLTFHPKKRITASGALEQPWMREAGEASAKPIDNVVSTRMTQFRAMNDMCSNPTQNVVAQNLSEEESEGLKQMLNNMDTDRSGTITSEELKSGLSRLGSKLNEGEIRQLMDAADVDKDKTIDYYEFIAAIMHSHQLEKEENLFKAFQCFDNDTSGNLKHNHRYRSENKRALIYISMKSPLLLKKEENSSSTPPQTILAIKFYITTDGLRQALIEHQMGDEATIDEVNNDVDSNKAC